MMKFSGEINWRRLPKSFIDICQDPNPTNIYLYQVNNKTLEKGVRYVQS